MPELYSLTILYFVGILAGAINVMAGGGSSLTLPALIFLGVDPTVANGTNRIAILSQNLSAFAAFHKDRLNDFRESLRFSVFTLPGVLIGSVAAVKVSDELFEKVLAVVLILLIFTFFFKPASFRAGSKTAYKKAVLYPSLVLIGFYGGFIQVGTGFLVMAVLYHLCNLTLVKVNVHKVFIILFYTLPAIAIFILSGNIDWFLGIGLALGNATGGFLGARLSVKGGEKYIRYALVISVLIIALKLLKVI